MTIIFKDQLPADSNQILALYKCVGWVAYTKEPERLLNGLAQSQVITAYVEEQLVGLIRCITDGQTILYIQDLLVAPAFQRQKLASDCSKNAGEISIDSTKGFDHGQHRENAPFL